MIKFIILIFFVILTILIFIKFHYINTFSNGEVWKKFRSTVNPIMLNPKTIKLYDDILKDVADDMIKRMRIIRNDKNLLEGRFDIEMNQWALESIAVVALGGRLNCLDVNLPDNSPTKKLIYLINKIFILLDKLDFEPSLWRYISTPNFRSAMKCYDEMLKVSGIFLAKAIEEIKAKEKSPDEEKSVLEKLLEIDEHVAVIMASDMLFAGVDTTANAMISILYCLAKNPDKQNKLREEILSKNEKQSYLKACVKEAMRLLPVVAGNLRVTSKEYEIFGYKIPEQKRITFAHQTLCMMEKHYPRPKEYIPERWIVDKTDPLYHGNAHPFAYSPFGFGTRSCIGRRIAKSEIEILLAKVIENFQVDWFGPPMRTRLSTITYMTGPFNFIFKDV